MKDKIPFTQLPLIKGMKYYITIILSVFVLQLSAQSLNREVFSMINLDYPGLEEVKSCYHKGREDKAAQALLKYYRLRKGIQNPNLDMNSITISEREQKWADEALEHTFYVHDGYQPSFNYGKDINWCHWPVKDNELRWQLHRHKWFTPMGKAYQLSKDEKYAREWTHQYMDWVQKNPLVLIDKAEYEMTGTEEVKGEAENVRFAWRPLETAHRLEDQINQFSLFIQSPSFTPTFLSEFLVNYHKHAIHTLGNYSDEGNHLLFEAQRMVYAGTFFPEFKDAAQWRKSGIDILNREIKKQVYDDGGQYELDLHYHAACINIFCKALLMADANGFRKEFPEHYIYTIENMIQFYMNVCFPDYTNPCFSDSKRGNPGAELRNYQSWHKLFPDNQQILYFATEGKQGKAPENLSKGFLNSGFFTFRNGWQEDATVMVVKAGPKGAWHCQPDNGTFELWFNGKNLFPDSGSYIYAGEGEVMKLRNWFRQTRVHNTLTLDNRNLETTESVTRLWQPEGDAQILVTENAGYKNLTHRRSVFFVDGEYFAIVDEARGTATGNIDLHYQLCDGEVKSNAAQHILVSEFEEDSQVKLQCFGPEDCRMKEEEGWYSTAYRQRKERTAVAFGVQKKDENAIRYVTLIYPFNKMKKAPVLSAEIKTANDKTLKIEVTVNGQVRTLQYQL